MTVEFRLRPNFIVIGAMKSATTSICDILADHPQAFICRPKEPNYFSNKAVFERGWAWYEALFAASDGKLAIGEGSTNYTKASLYPEAPHRIAKALPDARLIYMVRDPLERIESHWRHQFGNGERLLSLPEAMDRWPEMLDISLYWKQLSRYRAYYPDDRIQVLFFEDFKIRPQQVMAEVCRFLGIDPPPAQANLVVRSNASEPYVDAKWVRTLKSVPGLSFLRRVQPDAIRTWLRNFREPVHQQPEWTSALHKRVVSEIAPDAAQLLAYCGRPADTWSLSRGYHPL